MTQEAEGPFPVLRQVVLDTTDSVRQRAEFSDLDIQPRARALGPGARLLLDRSDDEEEPLRVYADLAGHPFCIFVTPS